MGLLLALLRPLLGGLLGGLLLRRHCYCHLPLAEWIDRAGNRVLACRSLEGRGLAAPGSVDCRLVNPVRPMSKSPGQPVRRRDLPSRRRFSFLFRNSRSNDLRDASIFFLTSGRASSSRVDAPPGIRATIVGGDSRRHDRSDDRPRPLARLRRRVHVLRPARRRRRHGGDPLPPRARRHRDAEPARARRGARDHRGLLPRVRVSRGSLPSPAARRILRRRLRPVRRRPARGGGSPDARRARGAPGRDPGRAHLGGPRAPPLRAGGDPGRDPHSTASAKP